MEKPINLEGTIEEVDIRRGVASVDTVWDLHLLSSLSSDRLYVLIVSSTGEIYNTIKSGKREFIDQLESLLERHKGKKVRCQVEKSQSDKDVNFPTYTVIGQYQLLEYTPTTDKTEE